VGTEVILNRVSGWRAGSSCSSEHSWGRLHERKRSVITLGYQTAPRIGGHCRDVISIDGERATQQAPSELGCCVRRPLRSDWGHAVTTLRGGAKDCQWLAGRGPPVFCTALFLCGSSGIRLPGRRASPILQQRTSPPKLRARLGWFSKTRVVAQVRIVLPGLTALDTSSAPCRYRWEYGSTGAERDFHRGLNPRAR
jgi:hypothetical protein